MPLPSPLAAPLDSVELGQLLTSTVESVVSAQHKLDEFTLARAKERDAAAPGELTLPPLWYTFRRVAIELEMAASVSRSVPSSGATRTELRCRPLDPTSVSLYGYQASSGLRVRVELAPQGYAEIVPPRHPEPDPEQPR